MQHNRRKSPLSNGRSSWLTAALVGAVAAFCVGPATAAPRGDGRLELIVVDSQTGQPIAARVHLRNVRGRPVKLRIPGVVQHGDHFYVDGKRTLELRRGQYTFDLEAGPEYRTQSGHFEIERHADDSKTIEMNRFANLREEGWWAGDLDVARPLADMPIVMRAEQLDVVPVTAWQNEMGQWSERSFAPRRTPDSIAASTDRVFGPLAGLDRRQGGGLLLFDGQSSDLVHSASEWLPSSLSVLQRTHEHGGHATALVPFAWDLPVWLASGQLDAVLLIHRHALRGGVVDNEGHGRPRDRTLFPTNQGNGRWSESIYYHVLNCGLKVPPAAGSGSGVNDNPVGANRVYAYCGQDFSYERWWDAVEAGRVFVTNGPLLRPVVRGHPPGYVFRIAEGESLDLEIGLKLATRRKVEYLQIVKNGAVAVEVRLDEWADRNGRLPAIHFDESGWFVIRAVTDNPDTYQFASSGPYWVEKAGRPRISRRSVQFFLDWLAEAADRLDPAIREQLLLEYRQAEAFWQSLLARTNAE